MRGWLGRVWLVAVVITAGVEAAMEIQKPNVPSVMKQEAMVEIPGGFFLMGADNGFPDERPQRRMYVERFFIDPYEVTNRRFRAAAMRPLHTYGAGYEAPDLPVVGVSWLQARAYCMQVGKRLPSEAEWEKAARGVDGRTFPWGNFWDPALANDGQGPRVVGSFPDGGSPYGVHDMAGNVWEWVEDPYVWHGQEPSQVRRVLRGGAWGFDAVFMRTTYRRHERPHYTEHRIGFRCTADVP
jgi:formylglycine-generating enzyme required for sulfatase activity